MTRFYGLEGEGKNADGKSSHVAACHGWGKTEQILNKMMNRLADWISEQKSKSAASVR